MHIAYLYDITLPSPWAAAIQILETARALCELGVSVDVHVRALHCPAAECLARLDIAPHPSLRLRRLPLLGNDVDHRALRAAIGRRAGAGRHVVMSRGESGIALLPKLARLSRPPRERLVYEAHRLCFPHALLDADPPLRGVHRLRALLRARLVRAREAATLRTVDAVVCLTHGVRAALEAEFGPLPQPCILPSGTAPPDGPPSADADRDLDIMYAGKLELRKGVYLLLHALRRLPGRRAWVVGGNPDQVHALLRAAHELGVADQVAAPGYLEPAQVRALYRRARVGVCPLPAGVNPIADHYTSPLKLLEMMSLGVPVVASDVAVVRDIVSAGDTALLVPPNDAAALAAGIERLLEDRGYARTLAVRAQERVLAFTWQARARRLLDHLEAV